VVVAPLLATREREDQGRDPLGELSILAAVQKHAQEWRGRRSLVGSRCAGSESLAIVLAKQLPVSRYCTHLKGHGGAKYAVREVRDHLPDNRFVLRTDVKSYYASIDHLMLLDQLAVHIKDRRVLNLLGQYLRRTSERGGAFWDYEKGISLRCPLSPLIGAFFLNAPDTVVGRLRLFYVRFMDDILILASTRWQLRGAVKAVNQVLGVWSDETSRQDLHRQDRTRLRLSWLPLQSGRAGCGQADSRKLYRESISAL
jgi:hypothetical protein